mgnify:CR=1 FL=1
MKKLLFLSAACWLAACEGPIFGSKKAPTFVIESPYADEQVNDMMTPDVYALAATRSVNRMLDQSAEVYEKTPAPKIYITEFKKMSKTLPDGLYYAKESPRFPCTNCQEVPSQILFRKFSSIFGESYKTQNVVVLPLTYH